MRVRGRRKTELSGTGAVRRSVAHDELREKGGVRPKNMWTVFGSFDIIFNVMVEFVFGGQFNNSVEDRLEGTRVERWHQLGGDWHSGGGR